MDAFEARLRAAVTSESATLQQAAEYLVAAGGKRLRPRLTFLVAEALGVPLDDALAVAAAAELVHTGSLIHDDIIDQSERRRNGPAVHVKFGVTSAVLAGDFLLARGLEQLTAAGLHAAADEWSRLLRELVEAEMLQHEHEFKAATGIETSRRIAAGKTAGLFAWCARVIAKTAALPQARVEAAHRMGIEFGLAFQIGDDLLDFSGPDAGKPKHNDLREGQLTVPVQLARREDPALDAAIVRAFQTRGETDFDAAYACLAHSRAHALGTAARSDCVKNALQHAENLTSAAGFVSQVSALLDDFSAGANRLGE